MTDGSCGERARFDRFNVDLSSGRLQRSGLNVPVQSQPFQVLRLLLLANGEVVSREQLRAALWPEDTFVDFEHGLNTAVRKLRQALEDSAENPKFVETLPRTGYRFIAPVEWAPKPSSKPETRGLVTTAAEESTPVAESNPPRRRRMLTAITLSLMLAVGFALWSRGPASRTELSESQLTRHSSDNPLIGVAISPDGKYLLFADTVGVHITLLQTGEVRDIQSQSEPGQRQGDWGFLWFPDSSRFLANRFDGENPPMIWQGSVMAGKLKKVRDNAIAWSFSPDGSSVAVTKSPRNNCPMTELWLMDAEGNDLRKLDDAGDNNGFGFVQWSPDSNRIAYIRDVRTSGEFRRLMESRDLKGSPPVTLLSDNALRGLYWLQDGRLLYVLGESDRTRETCNYWVARLKTEGTFSAAPKQLTHNTGFCVDHTSATSDSKKLVFLKRSFEVSVYVADLDSGTKRISPPRPLTSTEGQEWPVTWTPDSREVVFASNRGPKMGFFRYPYGGGEATPIVTGIESGGLGNLFGRVTPDGAWLLYEPFPDGYAPGTLMDLKKVPMTGGTPQVILRDALFDIPGCALPPSKLCAIATVAQDQLVFWSVDPIAGRGPELGRFKVDWKSDYGWALSPDGTRIAIKRRGAPEIYVLSIKTRSIKTITVRGWNNGISLDWTADGSGFFMCTLQPRAVLLQVDLEGNATPLWEPKGSNTTWALASPDGQHIAMPSAAVNGNAWMIRLKF